VAPDAMQRRAPASLPTRHTIERLQYRVAVVSVLHPTRKSARETGISIWRPAANRSSHVHLEERQVVAIVSPDILSLDIRTEPQREAKVRIYWCAQHHGGRRQRRYRYRPARTCDLDHALAGQESRWSLAEPIVASRTAAACRSANLRWGWRRPAPLRESALGT
jgi:hypothetical protein